eukprot:jgi/Picre1/33218/NNA_008543.t1
MSTSLKFGLRGSMLLNEPLLIPTTITSDGREEVESTHDEASLEVCFGGTGKILPPPVSQQPPTSHHPIQRHYTAVFQPPWPAYAHTDSPSQPWLPTLHPAAGIAAPKSAQLRSLEAIGKTLPLAGLRGYTTEQVVRLCETLADCDAKVRDVPVWVLKAARNFLRSFQWPGDAADRLAFADLLSAGEDFTADMTETYRVLGMDESSVSSLEDYLQEYFTRILKKLKEVGASSKQTNFYV